MQRVLHPQRYSREQREAKNRGEVDNSLPTLNATIDQMKNRFSTGKPAWNPMESANYKLGYAFKKHLTPIVQALVKPGVLTDDDKAKLQSMKAVIDAKLGVPAAVAPAPAETPAPTPAPSSTPLTFPTEGVFSGVTIGNPSTGGRRKTRKTKTRKTKSRKSRR